MTDAGSDRPHAPARLETSREAEAAASRRREPLPRWARLVVGALLAFYAVMAFTASLSKGVSFDEGQQLAVGYNLWLRGDYRMEGANGDFVKRWATLPYLWTRPAFVSQEQGAWQRAEPYQVARLFFFELGNRPEWLLAQGRAMVVLLGVALGLLIFAAARELFGWRSGLVALGLFSFSPHMLAFGAIVSTDLSIALMLPLSTWCIWRLLHRITWGRLLASLAVFGLLLLAKMTALVIFPIAALLVAIRLVCGRAWTARWGARTWTLAPAPVRILAVLALVLLHGLAGWGALWAHYGFRYDASPNPADPRITPQIQPSRDPVPSALERFVKWSERTHFLPQGYCRGVDWLLGSDDALPAFMGGAWKLGGWRWFFPYTIWVKTQPTLFVLLALGAWAWWRARRRHDPAAQPFYAAAPHLVLLVVYLAIAVTEDINLGHRHVLPIYPALYVLAGAAALDFGRRALLVSLAVSGLLAWRVTESLRARPHYLAYFGPQAGGSEAGYKHLVDSSLDWGMNLPPLKRWLDANNPGGREPVFLAYFGTDSPDYHGIKSHRLPGYFDWRTDEPYALTPGYYAISASLFQGVYLVAFGPWNALYEEVYQSTLHNVQLLERANRDPALRAELLRQQPNEFWGNQYKIYEHFRFARLCAWLRHRGEPPHDIGHSIFIWKLSLAELQAALFDPPVELVEPSPEARQVYDRARQRRAP